MIIIFPFFSVAAESDLATFVQIKNHFQTNRLIDTSLFTPSSRSDNLRELYDAAAKTPVGAMAEMDRILGENERRSSDIFLCTPVLGMTRRRMKSNIDVEIETRMVSGFGVCVLWGGGDRTCFFYIYFSWCCNLLCAVGAFVPFKSTLQIIVSKEGFYASMEALLPLKYFPSFDILPDICKFSDTHIMMNNRFIQIYII